VNWSVAAAATLAVLAVTAIEVNVFVDPLELPPHPALTNRSVAERQKTMD